MSVSVFLKIVGGFFSSAIAAMVGYLGVEQLGVNPAVAGFSVFIVSLLISLSILKTILNIAHIRRLEARLKYSEKSFDELQTLFLADPEEASLFINIARKSLDYSSKNLAKV